MMRLSTWKPKRRGSSVFIAVVAVIISSVADRPPAVAVGNDGRLSYVTDALGNRVPDFSHAGYRGGGVRLPDAPVRIVVTPTTGNDGPRIQAAIDYVAQLAPDASGMRGAVLLKKGRYEIGGALRIAASGIVLRGEGQGAEATVLIATGTDRRTLIEIAGRSNRETGVRRAVTDGYVPVGAMKFRVANPIGLRAGDRVFIERPSPKEWIELIGMGDARRRLRIVWRPGTVNVVWDRVIADVSGDEVTLDAPLTTALEQALGGATVAAYVWPGRIEDVGVENLRCESEFDPDNPSDEEHSWMAISLDAVQNAWVENVAASNFVSSAVDVRAGAKWVTVEDCTSLAPISELAGYRRHSFHTSGQLTLWQRCRSEGGLHDFTSGYLSAGPNVFLDCEARRAHGFSGSVGSWASGVLFDNVHIYGGELNLDNLENWNQNVGWAAANSVLWRSSASQVICSRPPGAQNWAIGVWSHLRGGRRGSSLNEAVFPESLYRVQLAERRGEAALASLGPEVRPAEVADGLTLEEAVPDLAAKLTRPPQGRGKSLANLNGWLVADERLLVGGQIETPSWIGHLLPERAAEGGMALTRFAPGRSGFGLTDDLETLAESMIAGKMVALRHHWGLWYDRRRNVHQTNQYLNGDVWPPFLEQPWARRGEGRAWNGLSRYDLSRFNPWYFGRLRQFAEIGRMHGLVLINEMYSQHNLLEAGAHWADFPWRPANCVQATDFPEPPQYVKEKCVLMAEPFYDVSHPVRRDLHRAYIRQCLANLADQPNVIHTTGDEFSGPLLFVQFWLDVVAEWEAEAGRRPLIALSAPKDVQDAILADPRRGRLIDVIDLKYWWRTDSDIYAPRGGENLTPRQHESLWKGGRPTPASIARMVHEYRERFPEKAIITDLPEADEWAFAAAGGSLPRLPASTDPRLLEALPRMRPLASPGDPSTTRQWTLGDEKDSRFIVSLGGSPLSVDLSDKLGTFVLWRIDPATGQCRFPSETVTGGRIVTVDPAPVETMVVWLTRS